MNLTVATAEVEALLRAGPLETAHIVDVYLRDGGTRHYSDLFAPLAFDDGTPESVGSVTYFPLGDRIIPPKSIKDSGTLDPAKVNIFLDASRAVDGSDPVGEIVDLDLTQQYIRLRKVLFRPGTSRSDPLWIYSVRYGVIDTMRSAFKVDETPALRVSLASGAFAYNEVRNMTYGPVDQKKLNPGDTGFDHIARLNNTKLPWKS